MKVDKLIVTNRTALRRKYGRKAVSVDAAIKRLIAADKTRGTSSTRVDLDTVEPGLNTPGIAATTLQRLTKLAIDKAFTKHTPAYLMILGATDVVPMMDLANPVNNDGDPANDDDDPVVPSDLPYACEATYDTNAATFLGPVRVLSRLPDMVGATKPDYLLGLLDRAATWKQRSRTDYAEYFSLSALVWKKSTELSTERLFKDASKVRTSPPGGPDWSASALAPRIHFINCHGSDSAPKYFGQRGEKYPTSHWSPKLVSKITEGTVVAAECCYGAQLYDPANPMDRRDTGVPGIAVTYLDEGAYGVFGSTTIAYGPSEGNGQADLMCRYFIQAVLEGSSLGRAALEARQRFATELTHLDPSDLKTIAQFYLLADPSIAPIAAPTHSLSRTPAFRREFGGRHHSPGSLEFRRERAIREGRHLLRTLGAAVPSRDRVPAGVRHVLTAIARESGLKAWTIVPYRVKSNRGRTEFRGRRIYTLTGTVGGRVHEGGRIVAISATTEDGEIVHLRRVHSR